MEYPPTVNRLRSFLEYAGLRRRGYRLGQSEKVCKVDAQPVGEFLDDFDRRISGASFDVREVRPVEECTVCQFLLRQFLLQTQVPDGKSKPHSDMFVSISHMLKSFGKIPGLSTDDRRHFLFLNGQWNIRQGFREA